MNEQWIPILLTNESNDCIRILIDVIYQYSILWRSSITNTWN